MNSDVVLEEAGSHLGCEYVRSPFFGTSLALSRQVEDHLLGRFVVYQMRHLEMGREQLAA